jgi:uncharacterized DUF497 family protein
MSGLSFTWDEQKNVINQEKHDGVSFEEARTVFMDEHARLRHDPAHSDEEDRFILLGLSSRPNLLVVCHCYRESESVIRIISARKANKKEEITYERFRNAR